MVYQTKSEIMRTSDTPSGEVEPSEIADLSLAEAIDLEESIESEHDTCPECGEEYIEVGVYNDGAVQFTHGKNGMFTDGCPIEDPERVSEVLPRAE